MRRSFLRRILAEEGLTRTASRNPKIEDYRNGKFDVHVYDVWRGVQRRQYTLMKGVPFGTVRAFGKKYGDALKKLDVATLKRLGIDDTWSNYDSLEEWMEDGAGMVTPVARPAGASGRLDNYDEPAWAYDFSDGWVFWDELG